MSKIKNWSASIIRHFWYCSSSCRVDESTSDEDAFKKNEGKLHSIFLFVLSIPCIKIEEKHLLLLSYYSQYNFRTNGSAYSITSAINTAG